MTPLQLINLFLGGNMAKIKRTLISVSNKKGIVEFAKELNKMGVEIISTGGTARALKEAKIPVIDIDKVTGFPEMLDGRVKTLHPKVHGALLALRGNKKHMEQIKKHKITPIDMVVVNLYPFAETIAKKGVTLEEAIENIDIGGPSMIRSASKNFASVVVVVDPADYKKIIAEMKKEKGTLLEKTKFELAQKAFGHTADYDTTIYNYLAGKEAAFKEELTLKFKKMADLRYGENPHQKAAFYIEKGSPAETVARVKKLHGKELSFNNYLDLNAAWSLVSEFSPPSAVIVKHTNPCGTASAEDISTAYKTAFKCDPVSAFGSIVALNRNVDGKTAREINKIFVEVVIAPSFSREALKILTQKKDIRLLETGSRKMKAAGQLKDYKRVSGGLLVQDLDVKKEEIKDYKVVTKRAPTKKEWEDLLFAWAVVKHVKSNAIVIAKNKKTLGVGAGQMSRVDSTEIALKKAGKGSQGAVLASDAFFPFRDAVDLAGKSGIKAIIEPGGSVRDEDAIAAANQYIMAMVFTGARHFKH